MSSGASYPIEEFLEAITAQLDQTQDALRLKAVNRPLTFALKDFNVDLKVFVEMDIEGRVAFRPAAPNEEGASTVSIGFTTITRPMIEENTISMEMAQAPTLDELGLERDEQRQLAKIGVRNGAQLRNLERSAGEATMSRHTGVDLGRLKQALEFSRPRLNDPVPDHGPAPDPTPYSGPTPDPVFNGDPQSARPLPGPSPIPNQTSKPVLGAASPNLTAKLRQRLQPMAPDPTGRRLKRLHLSPEARDVRLGGQNLIENGKAPTARLDGHSLSLIDASPLSVAFALPPDLRSGQLNVELPDGSVESFELVSEPGGTP